MSTDTSGKEAGAIERRIRERIARVGPITYETFVEMALFDEDYGYYRAGKRVGNDYYTSPEIHPAFGRTIGRWLDMVRANAGAQAFAVIELGGASGRLARDILSSLKEPPEGYVIVERGIEREEGLIRWVNSVEAIGSLPDLTIVIANEFFDALPFHRILNKDGEMQEIYLGYGDGFFESTGPLSGAAAFFLNRYPMSLGQGRASEITAYGWPLLERLSASLGRACLIVFDYGYHNIDLECGRFPEGSTMAYRAGSTRASPFAHLGDSDITHHVNFDHLTSMLGDLGWTKEGETEQYRFLLNAGIIDEFGPLPSQERLSAKWLINPEGLGSMISVLGFSRGLSISLPGFRRAERGEHGAKRIG